LAGGKGTRLHPFSVSFPKPLMPLGDKPVLEILVRRLIQFGVRDICLTLGHLGELMRAYFDHRRKLLERINLRYVQEETPTGTAGSLASVGGLDETFLVMNGDLLTDLDFDGLVEFHRKQAAALTIATHTRTIKIDLGVLDFDAEQRITGYREKPVSTYHVSMGIYVYEPRVLSHIEPGNRLDFPDLVLRLLDRGERVCAYPTNCLWLDIGRPDDYAKAQELFAEKREAFEHV
jgi:NDP-sugar pyrophosphorylase family protein